MGTCDIEQAFVLYYLLGGTMVWHGGLVHRLSITLRKIRDVHLKSKMSYRRFIAVEYFHASPELA